MSSRIMVDAAGPGDNPPPEPAEPPQPPSEPEPAPEPAPEPPETVAAEPAEPEQPLSAAAQKRIDRLNFERHEAIRQRDEMRAEYQRWVQSQQQQQPTSSEYERGRREAEDRRVAETFNEACNTLFNRGVEEYGQEMGEARDRLNAVGWGNRPDALAAVTQLPDGHRVYRELSLDLDRAKRVLNLPTMAMAMELARMSGENVSRETSGRDAAVTRAPEPVSRIGGSSRAAERPLDHPQTSMAEFIRRRDAQGKQSRILR